MIITIDGPTASGKSTIARLLAKELGCYYLNSGLLYRAVAYLLVNHELYREKELLNPDPVDLMEYLGAGRLVYDFDKDSREVVLFDGENITPFLKTSLMDKAASMISANEQLRTLLLGIQREVAQKFDLVAEGRDMGSVVFPEADIKFYLTAKIEVRSERWREEQFQKGDRFSFEKSVKKVEERDSRDKVREVSPLVIPDNSIVIDNSELSIQDTTEKIMSLINKNKRL